MSLSPDLNSGKYPGGWLAMPGAGDGVKDVMVFVPVVWAFCKPGLFLLIASLSSWFEI